MMDIVKPTTLITVALFSIAQAYVCQGQRIDDRGIFARIHEQMRPVAPRPDTVSMVFIGDVMLHDSQIRNSHEKYMKAHPDTDPESPDSYDFSRYFASILDRLSGADLAVANMEFTLGGPPYSGYPAFSAPDSYAEYAAECGIDVFLAANNHILDKGAKGAERTMRRYEALGEEYGILTTGVSADSAGFLRDNPLILEVKDLKIALVNFTYGTNMSVSSEYPKVNRAEKHQLSLLMERARESGADLVIALPHWGVEYSMRHSPGQFELAGWLAEHGADLVIGAHPHVVQDSTVLSVEDEKGYVKRVPVIYSLGNAISNMSARGTQIGLLARIQAVKHLNGKVDLLPEFEYLWCSLPGRLEDTHCTVPVKEYIGKRGSWEAPYEYDKMISTYRMVKTATGIPD